MAHQFLHTENKHLKLSEPPTTTTQSKLQTYRLTVARAWDAGLSPKNNLKIESHHRSPFTPPHREQDSDAGGHAEWEVFPVGGVAHFHWSQKTYCRHTILLGRTSSENITRIWFMLEKDLLGKYLACTTPLVLKKLKHLVDEASDEKYLGSTNPLVGSHQDCCVF